MAQGRKRRPENPSVEMIGAFRTMWVIVMFDLPVDNPESRKNYQAFRKSLLENSFTMLQFSVYARHAYSPENAATHIERTRKVIPPDGHVRIFQITDKQFERMKVYNGKTRGKTEKAPEQLTFF